MFDQKDFIPKTLSVHWLKGIQTESFDAAIASANAWIKAESVDVLNIETIVLPVGPNDATESPNVTGAPVSLRQFIRVWYRKSASTTCCGRSTNPGMRLNLLQRIFDTLDY